MNTRARAGERWTVPKGRGQSTRAGVGRAEQTGEGVKMRNAGGEHPCNVASRVPGRGCPRGPAFRVHSFRPSED